MDEKVITMMRCFLRLFKDRIHLEEDVRRLMMFYSSRNFASEDIIGWLVLIKNIMPLVKAGDQVLFIKPRYEFLTLYNYIVPEVNITWTWSNSYIAGHHKDCETKFPLKGCKLKSLDKDLQLGIYKLIVCRDSKSLPEADMAATLLTKDGTMLLVTNITTLVQWNVNEQGTPESKPFNFNNFNYDTSRWDYFIFLQPSNEDCYLLEVYVKKLLNEKRTTNKESRAQTSNQQNAPQSSISPQAFTTFKTRAPVSNRVNDSKLEKAVEDESECPVCFLFLKPPISTCTNGHNICCICAKSVNSCPVCRAKSFYRNLTLEKILQNLPQPCKGEKNGCPQICPPDMLELHEANCKFVQVMSCSFPGCNAQVATADYREHIKKHKITVMEALEHSMVILKADIQQVNQCYFIKSSNSADVFQLAAQSVGSEIHYFVKLIGAAERKFDYLMETVVDLGASAMEFTGHPQIYSEPDIAIVKVPRRSVTGELFYISCSITNIK